MVQFTIATEPQQGATIMLYGIARGKLGKDASLQASEITIIGELPESQRALVAANVGGLGDGEVIALVIIGARGIPADWIELKKKLSVGVRSIEEHEVMPCLPERRKTLDLD